MDTAYQESGDCLRRRRRRVRANPGPNEAEWDVSEQPGGRVQCAPQKVGIRFDWTDDLTNILSSLIDFDGSYKDTYDQWVDAGPIIPQG